MGVTFHLLQPPNHRHASRTSSFPKPALHNNASDLWVVMVYFFSRFKTKMARTSPFSNLTLYGMSLCCSSACCSCRSGSVDCRFTRPDAWHFVYRRNISGIEASLQFMPRGHRRMPPPCFFKGISPLIDPGRCLLGPLTFQSLRRGFSHRRKM